MRLDINEIRLQINRSKKQEAKNKSPPRGLKKKDMKDITVLTSEDCRQSNHMFGSGDSKKLKSALKKTSRLSARSGSHSSDGGGLSRLHRDEMMCHDSTKNSSISFEKPRPKKLVSSPNDYREPSTPRKKSKEMSSRKFSRKSLVNEKNLVKSKSKLKEKLPEKKSLSKIKALKIIGEKLTGKKPKNETTRNLKSKASMKSVEREMSSKIKPAPLSGKLTTRNKSILKEKNMSKLIAGILSSKSRRLDTGSSKLGLLEKSGLTPVSGANAKTKRAKSGGKSNTRSSLVETSRNKLKASRKLRE